ncbi:hypothetical protein [Chitinophaga varians]|uniref:hypothetical protein n=1 Tax=Chitinophaga varians TaxID=2202339 RepID=UPI00165F9627|nr:hypothetical protein [Chitinophaga varians]MBC9915105.1 hypothetical protein [Chitinophaga varians]
MKKVTILFSAIAAIAGLAGAYTVKSNVDDKVYLCNLQNNVCDIALNATLLPNGAPVGQQQVSTIITACSSTLCTVKNVYHPF